MYSFNEILGNNEVKERLGALVKAGKVSHAYIISGRRGTGKKLLAGVFAKALQCAKGRGEPCGECVSCRVFDAGNHPDVFYVAPQKTKTIGVDDIREQVVAEIATKPYRYRHKIFIIEDSDKMTASAQNALLKTLEEPPEYAVFLLLATNPEALLATVKSRAVEIKTRELRTDEMSKYLSKHLGIPTETAEFYAEYARGSLGEALSMAESEDFRKMREDVLSILEAVGSSDITTVMGFAKKLEEYKERPEFLDIFQIWFRDLLMVKSTGDTGRIIAKDRLKELLNACGNETVPKLINKIEAVSRAKDELLANANFVLAMEIMLIKIKENT